MEALRVSAFFDFIKERESIRLRKESGALHPLTEDPILREYKFTNVRRQHDRTSRNLREHFYTPHFNDDPRSLLMNAALFRYFGTFEFAEAVGWQDYETFDFEEIKRVASMRLDKGLRVFTGAYVITNQGISAPKQDVVVDYFLRDLHKAVPRIIQVRNDYFRWEQVSKWMMKINGFGGTGFMTKEILLDTTYTNFWVNGDHGQEWGCDGEDDVQSWPEDWWLWTPIGPGARRGAARVAGIEDMNSREAGQYLKSDKKAFEVINVLCHHVNDYGMWPENWGRLCPTDIQFQLCEFDKYERVRLGQGRPRSKYRPS